jgi:hypothetical protein
VGLALSGTHACDITCAGSICTGMPYDDWSMPRCVATWRVATWRSSPRLGRYRLFLEQLLQHTVDGHADRSHLTSALKQVCEVRRAQDPHGPLKGTLKYYQVLTAPSRGTLKYLPQ